MDNKYVLIVDNELCHHGVKGQKWGVRRYQTRDGSLTPAGKKRYSDDGQHRPSHRASNRSHSGHHSGHRSNDRRREEVQRNLDRSTNKGRRYVERHGNARLKRQPQKVADKYAKLVQRQLEYRLVGVVVSAAIKGVQTGLPLLIALL